MTTDRGKEMQTFEASIEEWNTMLRFAAEGAIAMGHRPDINAYRLRERVLVLEGFVKRLRAIIGKPDK